MYSSGFNVSSKDLDAASKKTSIDEQVLVVLKQQR